MGKPVSREPGPMLIERPPPARLDPTVKALGFVTLLNDLSSEVAVRTLPLFLANVLGVKAGVIGFIEGLAESTATLLKVVSGVLADRVGKKKALALWGYGLSGFTKPLLFFAASWPLVLVVRVLDRIGTGIRTAPRDVLIADVTAPEARGRAFGFNKAMDKAGAVVGLVLAAGILYVGGTGQVALTRENYQALVLLSVIPGIASVLVLARWVREGPRSARAQWSGVRLAWRGLDGRFRAYLVMLVIFTLGNSSDAFLMLRAQTLGFPPVEIFLLLAGFNLIITVSSTPAGALSDRLERRGLIVVGWVIYAVIYLGFAYASSAWHIWALLPWLWPLLRGLPRRGQCLGGRSGSVRAPRDGLRLVQWGNRCRRIPGQPAGRPPLGLVRPARAVPGRRGARARGQCRNARDSSAIAALTRTRAHALSKLIGVLAADQQQPMRTQLILFIAGPRFEGARQAE